MTECFASRENDLKSGYRAKQAIQIQLASSLEWSFDIFAFSSLSDGHSLYFLGFYMMEYFNLIRKFDIDPDRLRNFLLELESAYLSNPYHNALQYVP